MHFSLTIFGASLPQPVLLSVMNADVSKRGKQPLSLSLFCGGGIECFGFLLGEVNICRHENERSTPTLTGCFKSSFRLKIAFLYSI